VSAVARPRVALRPIERADDAAMRSWLASAYAAVDGERPANLPELGLRDFGAAISRRWPEAHCFAVMSEGDPIGFLIARSGAGAEQPETAILALAIRADRRNLGYGGEAVMVLEEARPGDRFAAAIPRANGLAVYFWLRTGYRPVTVDEDALRAGDPDHLWMVRADHCPD